MKELCFIPCFTQSNISVNKGCNESFLYVHLTVQQRSKSFYLYLILQGVPPPVEQCTADPGISIKLIYNLSFIFSALVHQSCLSAKGQMRFLPFPSDILTQKGRAGGSNYNKLDVKLQTESEREKMTTTCALWGQQIWSERDKTFRLAGWLKLLWLFIQQGSFSAWRSTRNSPRGLY